MGLSYQDYLNGRRVTKAKNLFRTSTWSLTDIVVFLVFTGPTSLG